MIISEEERNLLIFIIKNRLKKANKSESVESWQACLDLVYEAEPNFWEQYNYTKRALFGSQKTTALEFAKDYLGLDEKESQTYNEGYDLLRALIRSMCLA